MSETYPPEPTKGLLPTSEATARNTAFSRQLPGLQVGLDSTSLGSFKSCPQYYYLSVVQGLAPKGGSPHLVFGIELHNAREVYDHAKVEGLSHDDALDRALAQALSRTWNKALNRPWISSHPAKNRPSLIRTIVWYLDQFGKDDPVETLVLANGKSAVELSFRFDSGLTSKTTEEALVLCGHLDRIGKLGNGDYIIDIKSTGSNLGPNFFQQFTPDNQFSLYALAGKVAFGVPIRGLIVDGVQVGAGFSDFQRAPVDRSESILDEWVKDLSWYYKLMESCAVEEYWPRNDKACGMYGGCRFRGVCSRSPASRDKFIATEFVRRTWDPMVARGTPADD